jgi:hypothetical protein
MFLTASASDMNGIVFRSLVDLDVGSAPKTLSLKKCYNEKKRKHKTINILRLEQNKHAKFLTLAVVLEMENDFTNSKKLGSIKEDIKGRLFCTQKVTDGE